MVKRWSLEGGERPNFSCFWPGELGQVWETAWGLLIQEMFSSQMHIWVWSSGEIAENHQHTYVVKTVELNEREHSKCEKRTEEKIQGNVIR